MSTEKWGFMKKIFSLLVITSWLVFIGTSIAEAKPVLFESKHFLVSSEVSSEGQEVLKIAEEAYSRITVELGFEPKRRVKIHVFRSYSRFVQESGYKGKGEIAGLARPTQGEIFICSTIGNLRTTTIHELSHVVFLQSVDDMAKIPFWFVEGLAIYQSAPTVKTAELEELALEGDLPTIAALSGVSPLTPEQQKRIAAQGYLAVRFIAESYGQDKLYDLVKKLQAGQDFEMALEQATGMSKADLERLWRGYMKKTWRQTLWATLRYFGWTLLPLVVIVTTVAWLIKRRKKLEKLEELDREETSETGGRD